MTRTPRRWLLALVCLALTQSSVEARAAAKPPDSVPARVDKVLVYSTEARVFRKARVDLRTRGARRVALVDLPRRVLPDTVRVECSSARVEGVEVIRTRGNLPRQARAKELVRRVELVADKLADLADEGDVLQEELRLLESLGLRREPEATGPRPPEGLFADAWQRILGWMSARTVRLRARLATLAEARRMQRRELHKLRVEAKKNLDPAAIYRQVSRVVATVKGGQGAHTVRLSYRVAGVRWVPSYDLRYLPSKKAVEATYYAVVDQHTGEDWPRARLRFSTGYPTQLLAVPELPTWSLGRKRDFTPTPRPRAEPAPQPWSPRPPPRLADPTVARLVALVRGDTIKDATKRPESTTKTDQVDNDRDGILDVDDKPADPEDKNAYEDEDGVPDVPPQEKKLKVLRQRVRRLREQTYRSRARMELQKETLAGKAAPSRMPPPAPPRASVQVLAKRSGPSFSFGSSSSYVPREPVPWTDTGYRGPSLHKDLPAAAAKGYHFTLYAPGKHTVKADGTRRRVPVLRKRLRVQPVYRVLPGASKRAYLMARVKNTTGRPILRGHANLFAGTMFSGRSWLNTSLPGRTIQLPLGVDDGIKVERHMSQKTVVKGTFFKDDITEHTVTIEIANHHRHAIAVEVEDQIPVKKGRKVEVKAFSARPKATRGPDERDGKVTFKMRIAASSVKKLRLSYQIVRPKDWELSQHDY